MRRHKKRKLVVKNKIHHKFLILATLILSLTIISGISILNNHKALDYPFVSEYQEKYSHLQKLTSFKALPLPEITEHGQRDKKTIALTFDADMTYGMLDELNKGIIKSWYNRPLVDYLVKNNIKATIFLTGLWTKAYPKEAFQIAQNPLFQIGNHSYSHPAFAQNCFGLPFIPDSMDQSEVLDAQKIIIKTTGIIPEVFRFPGGCYDKNDVDIVSRLGLKIVHWDVVGNDGFNLNTQSIIDKVENNVQNGSIIVLHLNYGNLAPKTYDAIIKIIPCLTQKGYKFVKLSELIP